MKSLPVRPHFGHLKQEAKTLLAQYRNRDVKAINQFRDDLPATNKASDDAILAMDLRLHDAQSCVARAYGFHSWAELKRHVASVSGLKAGGHERVSSWLSLVYSGDIAGGMNRASPSLAARALRDYPDLPGGDPWLACAIGDIDTLRRHTAARPEWVNQPGGPLHLPPLVAVTHSSLLSLPDYKDGLRAAASFLLQAGADPNQNTGNRWPPASVQQPSAFEHLSALYGAAGQNHDAAMTAMLLDAGANPNDGESLYHSLENPACTRLLLQAGAQVPGSNALYRALDMESVEALQMLLEYGGNPDEPAGAGPTSEWGTPLLWAIRRRRSLAVVDALLAAGANPLACTPDGTSAVVLALRFNLPEIAGRLQALVGDTSLTEEDRFLIAGASGDEAGARRIQANRPDLPRSLSPAHMRMLPELAALACNDAVKLMVTLGWPIDVTGGDWAASALNHAVFRGDTDLASFLLDHGASWKEKQGFGDDVCGTLSWASRNQPDGPADWASCATLLRERGLPVSPAPDDGAGGLMVDGIRRWFSDEVTANLMS